MKKSSVKKRIIVLSATIGLSAIAVTGLTFGVLAATTQSAKNTFSVNYVANNVSATVAAHYKTKNGSDKAMETANGDTSVRFEASQGAATATFMPNEESNDPTTSIVLTAQDNYVILKNIFTNEVSTSPAGGRYLVVSLNDQSDYLSGSENVNISYFPSNYGSGTNYEAYAKFDSYGQSYTNVRKTYYVAPGETFYIYTLVEIDDDTLSSSVVADNNVTPFTLSTETAANVASDSSWSTWVSTNSANWGGAQQGGGNNQQASTLTAISSGDSVAAYQFDTSLEVQEVEAIVEQWTGWESSGYYDEVDFMTHSGNGGVPFNAIRSGTEGNYTYAIYAYGTTTCIWSNNSFDMGGGYSSTGSWQTANLDNGLYKSNSTITFGTFTSSNTGWNGIILGKADLLELDALAVDDSFSNDDKLYFETNALPDASMTYAFSNLLTYSDNVCNLVTATYDSESIGLVYVYKTNDDKYALAVGDGANTIYVWASDDIQSLNLTAGWQNLGNDNSVTFSGLTEGNAVVTAIDQTMPQAWNGVIVGTISE